jgi:structural maintenance of chromosome 4
MISHMKLVNFKSYAGTKIVGPFHKKFSAVVGPNGSGKSNVRENKSTQSLFHNSH